MKVLYDSRAAPNEALVNLSLRQQVESRKTGAEAKNEVLEFERWQHECRLPRSKTKSPFPLPKVFYSFTEYLLSI